MNDYSVTLLVDQSPQEVFDAAADVRGWWSEEIEGVTDAPGGVFTYHNQDVHRCTMKVIEFVPGEKVGWLCLANEFSFTADKTEWVGTRISFEIAREGDLTRLTFTHQGLVPAYECFEVCSDAWGGYVTRSLKNLITTGVGNPNKSLTAL